MLKWIVAAVLAVMTVPAQAVEFLRITGQGPGAYITQNSDGIFPEPAVITFEAWIPLNDFGCGAGVTCGLGSSQVRLTNSRAVKGYAEATLTFSGAFDPWMTTADDFVSGEARGSSGSGPGWQGSITSITLDLVDPAPDSVHPLGDFGVGYIRLPVPEPSTWLMLIGGFGMLGGVLRRRSTGAKVINSERYSGASSAGGDPSFVSGARSLKWIAAATLVASTVPAQAATMIWIQASGPATGTYEIVGDGSGPVSYEGTIYVDAWFPAESQMGHWCSQPLYCGSSGSTVTGADEDWENYGSFQLYFDRQLEGMPRSNEGFIGGVALGNVAGLQFPSGGNGSGQLTNLMITVFEDSDRLPSVRVFTVPNAIPEPATWLMLIAGFGVIGGLLRRHAKLSMRSCVSSRAI